MRELDDSTKWKTQPGKGCAVNSLEQKNTTESSEARQMLNKFILSGQWVLSLSSNLVAVA